MCTGFTEVDSIAVRDASEVNDPYRNNSYIIKTISCITSIAYLVFVLVEDESFSLEGVACCIVEEGRSRSASRLLVAVVVEYY